MRRLLSLAFLTAICAGSPAFAGEPNLTIGDRIPAVDIARFFQGEAIEEFSNDQTYVLEFWATW